MWLMKIPSACLPINSDNFPDAATMTLSSLEDLEANACTPKETTYAKVDFCLR